MDNVLLRGTYIVEDIEAGEPILVVKSVDPDAVYRRVLPAGETP